VENTDLHSVASRTKWRVSLQNSHFTLLVILTCGTFLHLIPNLGYRKTICLIPALSMPLDGAPITPKWPRDLVPRPPSMFHIIFFRRWSLSGKIVSPKKLRFFHFKMGFGSREKLPPTGAFLLLNTVLIFCFTASFWHLSGFLVHVFSFEKKRLKF
jgi:hypothetical protein